VAVLCLAALAAFVSIVLALYLCILGCVLLV